MSYLNPSHRLRYLYNANKNNQTGCTLFPCVCQYYFLYVANINPPLQAGNKENPQPSVLELRNQVSSAYPAIEKDSLNGVSVSAESKSLHSALEDQTDNINKIISILSQQLAQENENTDLPDDHYIALPEKGRLNHLFSKTRKDYVRASTDNMGFSINLRPEVLEDPFYKQLFSLTGKNVLDVGAGSGAICLNMPGKNIH